MNEPVYILKLGLQNVRCFKDTELDLSDGNGNWRKWTVILGDNGLGKTTLLQVLAGSEPMLTNKEDDYSPKFYEIDEWREILSFRKATVRINYYKEVSDAKCQEVIYKLDYQVPNIFKKLELSSAISGFHSLESSTTEIDWEKDYFSIGYGANRFLSNSSLLESKVKPSATLFDDDAKLINAEEWLLQLDYSASKESAIKEFAQKKRDQVREILIELLPDVTDIRFTEPTKENLKSNIEFLTSFGWVRIHELSLGYKTMVAWMVDLAARLFERYPDSDNPLAEPAIVLVDEIDLHLHPKWQRKIFDYLSEKFPQTQFIVTAHSPLVVQSAPKDANIVVLRKDGDHVVIDNNNESVQNWRLDQILNSDLFDFVGVRGPETEKWLEERRELRRKQTLTENEQGRLDELDKQAEALPTADDPKDIKAMEILREAAEIVKRKKLAAQ